MIDFGLSEEHISIKNIAKSFAEKEILPFAADLDKNPKENEQLKQNIIKKAFDLGFNTLLIPEKYGGSGLGEIALVVIEEELAKADISIASCIGISATIPEMMIRWGNEEQQDYFIKNYVTNNSTPSILCFGMTEPYGGTEVTCPLPGRDRGCRTLAIDKGDHYVLRGNKCFSSNAGVAKLYGFLARTTYDEPMGKSGIIVFVPDGTPGLSFGKKEDMMGFKASSQKEMILDDVIVPKQYALGKPGQALEIIVDFFTTKAIGTASLMLGVASSAYEYVLNYATQRISYGKQIIDHQIVAEKIAQMRMEYEAAKLLVLKAAWHAENNIKRDPIYCSMAKVYATEMARNVTISSLQVMGAYGYSCEYPIEKKIRDALAGLVIGPTNERLRIHIAEAEKEKLV